MPDLVAHLASGYAASIPFWQRRTVVVLFLVGVVLPDLATRPVYILIPGTFWLVAPMHQPVGYTLLCIVVAQFFTSAPLRWTAFWSLFTGGVLHFALDALQKHLGDGYLWFFPFCSCSYSWGLFWPEDSLSLLPLTAGLIVLLHTVWHLRHVRGS